MFPLFRATVKVISIKTNKRTCAHNRGNLETPSLKVLVTTYQPVLNRTGKVEGRLYSIHAVSEEHRWVFPYQPFILIEHCRNLKDNLVGVKLYIVKEGEFNKRGYTPYGNLNDKYMTFFLIEILLDTTN